MLITDEMDDDDENGEIDKKVDDDDMTKSKMETVLYTVSIHCVMSLLLSSS